MSNLAINEKAPDFNLIDYKGNNFQLSSFKEKSNILIVLNRGFVWPFCQKHMMQLHQDYNSFKDQETEIVVIGPEKPEKFKSYFEENGFKFYGLPDPNKTVLKLYGQEIKVLKLGRMPAQMLIDRNGILRYMHYGHSMKDIPENDEVLELIEKL